MIGFLTYLSSNVDMWTFVMYSVGLALTSVGCTLFVMTGKKSPSIETIDKLLLCGVALIVLSLLMPSSVLIEDIIFSNLIG